MLPSRGAGEVWMGSFGFRVGLVRAEVAVTEGQEVCRTAVESQQRLPEAIRIVLSIEGPLPCR